MTVEESKMCWEIEKQNTDIKLLPKQMQKLFKLLDKVIPEGVITYEEFNSDVIDELTTITIENTKQNTDPTRTDMLEQIAKKLYEKYKDKYTNRESLAGDKELQTDTAEIRDESGVCESECVETVG